MKEYRIKYQCGTSPYWYYVSLYAYSAEEAMETFLIRSDLCPANVRDIKIVEG